MVISGDHFTIIENFGILLMLAVLTGLIEICQTKNLINALIVKITKSMTGFKYFHSPQTAIDGIETA
jgi:hypothetical protein